jgi:hypothetical protein
MVEHLHSMYKELGSIFSITKDNENKNNDKQYL